MAGGQGAAVQQGQLDHRAASSWCDWIGGWGAEGGVLAGGQKCAVEAALRTSATRECVVGARCAVRGGTRACARVPDRTHLSQGFWTGVEREVPSQYGSSSRFVGERGALHWRVGPPESKGCSNARTRMWQSSPHAWPAAAAPPGSGAAEELTMTGAHEVVVAAQSHPLKARKALRVRVDNSAGGPTVRRRRVAPAPRPARRTRRRGPPASRQSARGTRSSSAAPLRGAAPPPSRARAAAGPAGSPRRRRRWTPTRLTSLLTRPRPPAS